MERNEFEIENGVLKAYHGPGGNVAIPAGVTAIGDRAFYDQRQITAVTIPDGVREIGDHAFSCCTSIRSMAVPGSVERIGAMTVHFCENLIEVTIGQGVRELGDEAFMDCRRLAKVSLPDSMTALGGEETLVPGTATNGVAGTVWTSTAPVSGEKAFYKVKVEPNR